MGPFTRKTDEAEALVGGAIPGTRGAPVRTPVKSAAPETGASLWPALAGRMLTRQLWIELYGVPGYGLTLKGSKVNALSAGPRDPRPADANIGKSILGGRFALAGTALELETDEIPWDRPSPSRAFAVDLHGFVWLAPLMSQGERGAREALRLTLAWSDHFARWSPFAWGPDILARRTFNLACWARRMGAVADDAERLRLTDLIARQARQLLRPPGGVATRAQKLTAAAAAGCVLAGSPGASIRRRALSGLAGALKATVGPDGGHASRSAEAGLELLLDLLTLVDGLGQISEPAPEHVTAAIERLTAGLRALVLPDGRLVSFQGGGPSTVERVAAARAHDEAARAEAGTPDSGIEVAGLRRVHGALLTVIADVETAPHGGWSETACAQPAAIEIICGKDRLITGSGWTPRAADRPGLRLTPGHSTLTLGEQSLGEPLGGWKGDILGPRLVGRPVHVGAEHRQAEGAVWLEIEHDGWAVPFGLMHQRRLYIDQRLDELRAEERLFPAPGQEEVVRAIAAPYAVRFHLEPGVQASLARDKRSILLRGHSGRGWWFRTDGPDVAIEPSVHIDDGLTRRSLQIVVRGSARTDAETKVRWKLSPAGASGDPT